MIDDKLIKDVLEGIEYLQAGLEKIIASNDKERPEPQAGDVCEHGSSHVFIYKDGGKLSYIYPNGATYLIECLGHGTRLVHIFSLSEYLKNKEADDV